MVQEHWNLPLDYPVRPASRYGYGKAPHRRLHELLEGGRPRYQETLDACAAYEGALRDIPPPAWACGWLSPLDLVTLYGVVAGSRPRKYLEVGSGCSTQFARRAVADHDLGTKIVSIDPEPRDDIDALCDHVVRQTLEAADLSVFDSLDDGDVVFFDGSHRCFTNSDVSVFFLDVLPQLPAGVRVGIDDVYLPWDYPPEWADRFYSEQYVLAAWLLGGADVEVLAPNAFIARDPELSAVADRLLGALPVEGLPRDGNSFWFRVR